MPKLNPEVEREIEAERARYTAGAIEDVQVTVAPDPGGVFEVRFDHQQLKVLFPALKEGENAIQFIRQAALEAARRRNSASSTEAAS